MQNLVATGDPERERCVEIMRFGIAGYSEVDSI